MDSCCEEDENQFFDARDDISVSSEHDSNCDVSISGTEMGCCGTSSSQFDIWFQNPLSVQERRSKFFNLLGLSAGKVSYCEDCVDSGEEDDKVTASNEEMVRCLSFGHKLSSCRSSSSTCSSQDLEFHGDKCIAEGLKEEEEFKEVNVSKVGLIKRLENSHVSHTPSRKALIGANSDLSKFRGSEKVGKWWLRKLRSFSCITDNKQWQVEDSHSLLGVGLERVKVRQSGKKQKELSALYSSQDFQAHEGSILVMKFSPDGRYLASAGEDRIVRVWKVVEDERPNDVEFPDLGPLCLYFRITNELELQPLCAVDKERMSKVKSWSTSSDSACVVLPPKVFRLLEKPYHEFKGHCGEILDLSWSHTNCLLSSSVDKTVRLWRVGCNHCLKVFSHNNYVTSIQFNPIDDNLFISGSIDGKVRIWDILTCQVVSWTDIKDIVTAVSYHPSGQGVLVGSIAGFCRYYNLSDGQLELDSQTCIRTKKKSSGKRIIGFQYFPGDPNKVLVTSDDSQVRILKGIDVIAKYKGTRSCGNYLSASFTSDGKHIVSACEDSNVYMWNCGNDDDQAPSRNRKIKSFERFQSTASLAIPWNGFQNVNIRNSKTMTKDISLSSPSIFPLEQDFFLESYYPKGSQTWPEEKLPAQAHQHLISSMQKTEYKFLRACQSSSSPHIWGLVMLTAGLNGRIRSFHNYGLPVSL